MDNTGSQADPSAWTYSETDLDAHIPASELLVGTLVDFDPSGAPRVRVALRADWQTLVATPAVSVHSQHIGRQAVLMRPGGELRTPLLLGFVYSPLDAALEQPASPVDARAESAELSLGASPEPMAVEVDGAQTLIEGKEEVMLRCGEASITLTRAGKIILRGKHLVSRSSGVNRIMGGSIQMN